MASDGRREEMDAKIKAWERELERLRVALARAPESVHAQYYPQFVEVYREKEVVKSRWEAIRGVYRPDVTEVDRFQEALFSMEETWAVSQSMIAEVLQFVAA
ncbi:MAG TPA: hypothetical protein VLG48_11465 [Candidatus Methylomirabilis sp.]|nr:hypothetical protein [Candidatus Methylomirabilis sp.]